MTAVELAAALREHEAKTLRLLADKLHAMTLVGGSPHLTEAFAAVTGFVRRLGDDVAAGSWSLHDDPAARAGGNSVDVVDGGMPVG